MKKILYLLLLLSSLPIVAQNRNSVIKGKVISPKNEPLPYVTILIKGSHIGSTSTPEGNFIIKNVPEGKITLRAQAVGYKPEEKSIEIKANEEADITFHLQEDNIGLNQVVVTADRNEVDRSETPVIINVISTKLLENTGSVCVADGLNFQPGLRVENNCQNCGFTQLRMNGMDGNYSQILINSRPVFSALSGVYGLEHIPAIMIDRLEIVRGGGSALFGANAIAGTVNIITKDPTFNSYQLSTDYSLINGQSNDITQSFNTSVVTDNRKSGMFLFGMYRNRQPYDNNNDGFSEITKLKNFSGGFNLYYKISKHSKINIDMHILNEFRRGGNKFNELPQLTDITEQVTHNIIGGGINYEQSSKDYLRKLNIYLSGQYTDRDSYYGADYDPAGYGKTKDLSSVAGFQYALNFSKMIFAPGKLTLGIENTYGNLSDKKLGYYDYPNDEYINERIIAEQKLNNIGSFLQGEWHLNKLRFLVGMRYDIPDKVLDIKPVFIPRMNVMYNITDKIQMRLSYAKGYRSPQIFDEDLHIEASAARMHIHTISENLKPETSQSFSSSIDYTVSKSDFQAYFLIEGFYTKLLNPFAKEYIFHDEDKELEVRKVNAPDGAYTQGINTEGKIAINNNLQFQAGATFQRAEYEKAQIWGEDENHKEKNILKSPEKYGYMIISYIPNNKFYVSVNGTFTGSMLVPHLPGGIAPDGNTIEKEQLVKTNSFFDIGFKLNYTFKLSTETKLQLNGGIQNILNSYQNDFDKGKYRDAGYIYGPSQPFSIFFGIKIGNFI